MRDFLFMNGTILTMNHASESAKVVLVRGNKIIYVGSEAKAKELASSFHTQILRVPITLFSNCCKTQLFKFFENSLI